MIKFNEQVPSVYPSASRDFQYLSWLIDIVLNSVKHNVDRLYDLPNVKTDARLNELLAMTLGFKVKRNYDQKQLAALVAVLPRILKYKGTQTAVDVAGNALIAAAGAVGSFSGTVTDGELKVMLPKDLIDISLFTDLLPYILPAGMTCRIIRTNQVQQGNITKLGYQDIMLAEWIQDLDWDTTKQNSTGLATMFDVPNTPDEQEPTFANFKNSNPEVFNAGLLDNSTIPMVTAPMSHPLPEYFAEPSVANEDDTNTGSEN